MGGNVGLSVQAPDSEWYSIDIAADQQTIAYFLNMPTAGTTVYITASPWRFAGNFRFMYWTITRGDGSAYRDYHRDLIRPGNTTDEEYFAEFKVCTWNAWAGQCDNDPACTNPWDAISCNAPGGYSMMNDGRVKLSEFATLRLQLGRNTAAPMMGDLSYYLASKLNLQQFASAPVHRVNNQGD